VQRDAIERLLPTMFQLAARAGSPLDAALHVMADLHEPDERLLVSIESVFDPYRTPDAFVPWLTGWVGLDWLVVDESDDSGPGWTDANEAFPPGLGRLREIVAVGAALAQLRGTDVGLRLFLAAATGRDDFVVTEPAERPFHLVVTAPSEVEPYAAVLRRIIETTKPAYTTAELTFAPAPDGAPPTPDEPVPDGGPITPEGVH
jgi:phage tail-like protein